METIYHLFDHESDDQSYFCGADPRRSGTQVFFYLRITRPKFRKICEECLNSERMGMYVLGNL